MTYTPTEKQVKAALNAFHNSPDVEQFSDCVKRMLIAAHDAADPVDTTEFERTLTDFRYSLSRRAELFQALSDLYVKAATR